MSQVASTIIRSAQVGDALETLRRHDVLVETGGHWQFTVEPMRRWVTRNSG